MSLKRGRKLKNFITTLVICGGFLFALTAKNAFALHDMTTYTKGYNGTLTAAEWNNLPNDFVNTWLPATLNGPLGIATTSPTDGSMLYVNGSIKATNLTGSYTGTLNAPNVSSGAFGANTGGGNYSFPGNVGIGTTNPGESLQVAGALSSIISSVPVKFISSGNSSYPRAIYTVGASGTSISNFGQSIQPGYDAGGAGSSGAFYLNSRPSGPSGSYQMGFYLDIPNTVSRFASWGNDNFNIRGLPIVFSTALPSTNVTTYDALRLNTDNSAIFYGNVGIGTTNPVRQLVATGLSLFGSSTDINTTYGTMHVVGDTNGYIQILADNSRTYGLTYQYTNPSSVPTFNIFGDYYSGSTSANLVFGTYPYKTNQLYLQNTGNVGIATTTPASTLDVNGLIKMRSVTITQPEDVINKSYLDSALALASSSIITQVATSSFWQGSLAGNIWKVNTGNVGIGTTNPGNTLAVVGNYLSVYNNVGGSPYITFDGNDSPGGVSFGKSAHNVFINYSATGVFGYNADTHNTIIGNVSTGNVGIGTTNPTTRLWLDTPSVTADNMFTINAPLGSSYMLWASGGVNMAAQNLAATTGDFQQWVKTSGGTWIDALNVQRSSGNVGIGTTAPNDALSIGSGGVAAPAGSSATGHNNTATYLSTDNYALTNVGYIKSAISAATSSITLWGGATGGNIWSLNSGNVGIGTTNPGGTLDVNGSLNVGNVRKTPFSSIIQNYNEFTTAQSASAGYSTFLIETKNNQTLEDVQYNGGAYLSGYTDVPEYAGKAVIQGGNYMDLAAVTANGVIEFYTGGRAAGNKRMIIDKSGNVGIGTTAPNDAFSIGSGGVAAPAGSSGTGHNNTATYLSSDNYALTNVGYVKSAISSATSTLVAGNLWNGSKNGNIWNGDAGAGNVGIGTTNPTFALDLGNGNLAGQYGIRIKNSNTGSGYPDAVIQVENSTSVAQLFKAGTGYTTYKNITAGDLGFYNQSLGNISILNDNPTGNITLSAGGASIAQMTILAGGNVGIGKTNPGTALDVNGTVTATGFAGPLNGTVAAINVSNGEFGKTGGGGNFIFGATVPGNVGIGTTNPSAVLSVQPSASETFDGFSYYRLADFTAGSGGNKYIIYGSNSNANDGLVLSTPNTSFRVDVGTRLADALLFGSGSSGSGNNTYFSVSRTAATGGSVQLDAINSGIGGTNILLGTRFSGENVGIGTTAPGAYKLKVAGDVAITGALLTQTGSDFAEEFKAPSALEPGTVVVMGSAGYKSVEACTKSYDKTVVGIVSDNPSIIAGRSDADHTNPNKVIIAMMGVVKVKVSDINGRVEKGDLLTTSGIKGYAMRAQGEKPGTIIGKALENLNTKVGEIKVLVNLQ